MRRTETFSDKDIEKLQSKRERVASNFADYTVLVYLLETAEKCQDVGSLEIALAHHMELQRVNEDVIARLHRIIARCDYNKKLKDLQSQDTGKVQS